LRVLSEGQVAQVLAEAGRLLREVGFEIRGKALRQRLLDYGLPTSKSGRVLFPDNVVAAAIAGTPRQFTLYDREAAPHAEIGGESVHFVPGSSGLEVLDHRMGQVRPATTADFIDYVRLADGLEHIAYLATAFSTGGDIEARVADAWRLHLCLSQSRRPVVSGAFTAYGVPRMAELMQLFRHDRADLVSRPLSIFTITPSGSFRYGEDSCQNLLDCVAWGIPIEIVPVTLMGLIAPVTLLDAAAFHVADVLAGLVMAQVVRPGAPVLFGGAPAAFHMQTATSPMAAIEALKLNMAVVQVAKTLNLPTQAYMALSDARFVDAQAGAETFGGALLAALAGINSVSGPGMLEYVLVFSLEKLVLDDALCAQALHFVRPVDAAADRPAADRPAADRPAADRPAAELAQEVLSGQHLLTAEHTREHWPHELHLPGEVIDRRNRDDWRKEGEKSLRQRAREEVALRLAAYRPDGPDAATLREMEAILRSGLRSQKKLPEIPPPPTPGRQKETGRRRKHRRSTR
jgi:trimethylamine--corrinoid protein Co-methyltransferase